MRTAGHDVLWVRESCPGITDKNVLEMAIAENRIVLTFDKDFGELAFKGTLPATCGIILLRFRKQSPELVARRVVSIVETRNDWVGSFAVVEEARIRMTPLWKS